MAIKRIVRKKMATLFNKKIQPQNHALNMNKGIQDHCSTSNIVASREPNNKIFQAPSKDQC